MIADLQRERAINGTRALAPRSGGMDLSTASYEVFIKPAGEGAMARSATPLWSWYRLDRDGLIALYGREHATMRDAFRAALDYRDRVGETCAVRINLGTRLPQDARDVAYLDRPAG